MVTAQIGSVVVGSLTVTVVSADLHGPVACQVDYQRELDVTVTPASAKDSVTYVSADAERLAVSIKEPTANGATLYLKPLYRGAPILEARLGGATGPIIATQEIDEFTIATTVRTLLVTGPEGTDGSGVGTGTMTIDPSVPELSVVLTVNGPGITFDNGLSEMTVSTNDFTLLCRKP